MGTIVREVIGWVLLAVGLYAFRIAFGYVDNRQVVEAGIVSGIGWIVFHAGLQFVRTAMLLRALQRAATDGSERGVGLARASGSPALLGRRTK